MIGIDCDVNRFERAIRKERKKVHIILLSSQLRAIRGYLKGKNAILHSLDTEIVEQALGLPKNFRIWIYHHFKNRMENICMSRILMFVQKYKSKIKDIWKRNQKRLPTYIFLFIAGLYLYGFLVHSIVTGIDNVWQKRENDLFTWNPVENVGSILPCAALERRAF